MGDDGSRGAFASAWSVPDFRRLLSGLVVSGIGNWLYNVALIVYVLDRTGSAGWVAAVSAARLVPLIAFSAIGGAVADRYDRRRVMLVSDLLRALFMVALAVAAAAGGPLVVIALIVSASSLAGTPYLPAVGALTPSMVQERNLAAANSMTGVVDNITITVGPALGSVLLLLGAPSTAIALNALTFLISAGFVWRIDGAAPGDPDAALQSLRQRLSVGWHALTGSPDIMLLVLVSFGFTMTFGMEIVLFPLIADDLLHTGANGLGWLLGASGLGGVLGTWVAARLAARNRTVSILVATSLLTALPLLSLTVIGDPVVAYAVLLVEGIGFVVGDVITATTLQRIAPSEVVGRIFGLLATVFVFGILVGNLIAGVTVDAIGLKATMVLGSAVLVATGLLALPRARRLDRESAERTAALAERVALLQELRLFEGASQAAVEAVAANTIEIHVAPDEVVVRKGATADAFFVIRSGTFVVTPHNRILHGGDYFGEIGILEGVPRTATVTATTDGDLYRIDAESFASALNEAPIGMRRISDTIAFRLARPFSAGSAKKHGSIQ